jgi:hypothetical protein
MSCLKITDRVRVRQLKANSPTLSCYFDVRYSVFPVRYLTEQGISDIEYRSDCPSIYLKIPELIIEHRLKNNR